jgi:hypothetical protein
VINPETIKLPVWVVGVGLVHAVALALVLPMLITLPAPTNMERKVEVVDVEVIHAARPAPKIDLDVDQTAALPSSPQRETPAPGETAPEPVNESPDAAPGPDEIATEAAEEISQGAAEEIVSEPAEEVAAPPAVEPDAVANVEPEAIPTATLGEPESAGGAAADEQAVPKAKTPARKAVAIKKTKAGGNGTKPKAAKSAPKKPAVAKHKPAEPKPTYRRTAQDVVKKGLAPFKGSWSQLLGGPTPVPAQR